MSIDLPSHLSDLNLRNKEFWEEDQHVNKPIKQRFINTHAFQVMVPLSNHKTQKAFNRAQTKYEQIQIETDWHDK